MVLFLFIFCLYLVYYRAFLDMGHALYIVT